MSKVERRKPGVLLPVLLLAVGLLLLYACASRPARDPAAMRAQTRERPACAITFDDGPGRHTMQLLEVLRSRNAHATFFVLGEQVRREPNVVRQMAAEGHEVDNHSYNHPDFRHLSLEQQQQEIDATQNALRALGIEPKFFRPPYGDYDAETVRAAARDGLVVVLWTVDGKDWKYHTVHALEANVEQGLKVNIGGIYLFHDVHSWTVEAMPAILDRMTAQGCRFVTLSEFFGGQPAVSEGKPVS